MPKVVAKSTELVRYNVVTIVCVNSMILMIINLRYINIKRVIRLSLLILSLSTILTGCAMSPSTGSSQSSDLDESVDDTATLITKSSSTRISDYSQNNQTPEHERTQLHSTAIDRVHYIPGNVPGDMGNLVAIIETDKFGQTNQADSKQHQNKLYLEHPMLSQSTVIDLADFPTANSETNQDDLWDRIRSGFKLDHEHPMVKGDLDWYMRHQAYLDRVVDRAQPYLHFIVEEAEKRNVPMELVLLPVVESAFQPFAYSHGRAAGIWQFIPSTGRMYGLKQNWWYDGRRDVYASTIAAIKFLKALSREFKGDYLLALAAYNSGAGTVRKAIRKSKRHNRGTDYWSIRRYLPKETKGYVPKLLAISKIIANPSHHNINLKSVENRPFLQKAIFEGQIDLALAADLAGISLDNMYRYNPGFNRWATDPKGPNYLLIPENNIEQFNEKLASLPPKKRTRWEKHRIRNGETLGQIARKYRTTTSVIKQVNKIRGNTIRAGRDLIIPVSVKKFNTYTMTADVRKKNIQNTKRKGKKTIYRVRGGDTLWDISRKYGVNVRQLAKWNAMAPRDPLKKGQRLTIWSNKQKTYSASRAAPPVNEITRKINYIVRKGDSLGRIAQKFRVSISQLRRWNRLPKNRYLQPGQRIKLFIDITRQSG